jgi:hypothetical protein
MNHESPKHARERVVIEGDRGANVWLLERGIYKIDLRVVNVMTNSR